MEFEDKANDPDLILVQELAIHWHPTGSDNSSGKIRPVEADCMQQPTVV